MTGIQSVVRASNVLDAVAQYADGCRLADVVRDTGLDRATTHRFLKALAGTRLVDYDDATARYFVGLKLISLAATAANRFDLVRHIGPAMRRLAAETADTVYLSMRIGTEAVCLAREEGTFPIKTLTLKVGDRRPLGVGAGSLALLAFLPDAEVEHLLALQAAAFATFGFDAPIVRGAVADSRRLGYALNEGRLIRGMSAVGVPVRAPDGAPVAALSVAAVSDRMAPERRNDIVAALTREAHTVESELGPLLGGLGAAARKGLVNLSGGPA